MPRRASSAGSAAGWRARCAKARRRCATWPRAPRRADTAAALMRHLARLIVICVTVLRYGLDELALSSFRQPLGALSGPRHHRRPDARRAARRAPAPRPRKARPDLRQVRPGALDPARHPAGRHRRGAGQAAGPRAAVSRRGRARDRRARLRPADRRGLRQLRCRAGRQRLDRAGPLRGAEGRPRGRGQGAAARHAGGDRRRRRGDAPGGARRSSAGRPTASG